MADNGFSIRASHISKGALPLEITLFPCAMFTCVAFAVHWSY